MRRVGNRKNRSGVLRYERYINQSEIRKAWVEEKTSLDEMNVGFRGRIRGDSTKVNDREFPVWSFRKADTTSMRRGRKKIARRG